MLSIHSLRKKYGAQLALDEVSLELGPGMVHGLVGKNGSGKTTLFRCICGLENYEGSISFSQGRVKEQIAFLPSTPYMMSYITGKEYLQLIANAKGVHLDAERINLFNLPLGKYASDYSTGMKKKLALTGLLISQHAIFLLDEPFSGVDLESNVLIQQLIAHLKSLGKTILISSHTLESLHPCADIIHQLDEGRIIRSLGPERFHELSDSLGQKMSLKKLEELEL